MSNHEVYDDVSNDQEEHVKTSNFFQDNIDVIIANPESHCNNPIEGLVKMSNPVQQLVSVVEPDYPDERILAPISKPEIPENIVANGDFVQWFNDRFDEPFRRLLFSETLEDVVEAFKIAEFRIGKAEYVTAIMLYHIHENQKELLPKFGYKTLGSFIRNLNAYGIGQRQSFYKAVRVGEVLYRNMNFGGNYCKVVQITPELFHKNSCKLGQLWIIVVKLEQIPNDEIMTHFRDDTFVQFKEYTKAVKSRIEEEMKKRRADRGLPPKPQKRKRERSQKDISKSEIALPDETAKQIIREVKLGHIIRLIPDANPSFVNSIKSYIIDRRNKEYASMFGISDYYKNDSEVRFVDMDASDLKNGIFWAGFLALTDAVDQFSIKAIHEILAKNFCSETQLHLVEAFLINRIAKDFSLHKDFASFNSDTPINTPLDFATTVLKIGESQFNKT
jgi:hypothetical protein